MSIFGTPLSLRTRDSLNSSTDTIPSLNGSLYLSSIRDFLFQKSVSDTVKAFNERLEKIASLSNLSFEGLVELLEKNATPLQLVERAEGLAHFKKAHLDINPTSESLQEEKLFLGTHLTLILCLFPQLVERIKNLPTLPDSSNNENELTHEKENKAIELLKEELNKLHQSLLPGTTPIFCPSNIEFELGLCSCAYILTKNEEYSVYFLKRGEDQTSYELFYEEAEPRRPSDESVQLKKELYQSLQAICERISGENHTKQPKIQLLIQKDIPSSTQLQEVNPNRRYILDITQKEYWETGYGKATGELFFRLCTLCGVETEQEAEGDYLNHFQPEKAVLQGCLNSSCSVGAATVLAQHYAAAQERVLSKGIITPEQEFEEAVFHEILYLCQKLFFAMNREMANSNSDAPKDLLENESCPLLLHLLPRFIKRITYKDPKLSHKQQQLCQGQNADVQAQLKALKSCFYTHPARIRKEIEEKTNYLQNLKNRQDKKTLVIKGLEDEIKQLQVNPLLACRPPLETIRIEENSKNPQLAIKMEIVNNLASADEGDWKLTFSRDKIGEADKAVLIQKRRSGFAEFYTVHSPNIGKGNPHSFTTNSPLLLFDELYKLFGKNLLCLECSCYFRREYTPFSVETVKGFLGTAANAVVSILMSPVTIIHTISVSLSSKTTSPLLTQKDLQDLLPGMPGWLIEKLHKKRSATQGSLLTSLENWFLPRSFGCSQVSPLFLKALCPEECSFSLQPCYAIFGEDAATFAPKLVAFSSYVEVGLVFGMASLLAKRKDNLENEDKKRARELEITYRALIASQTMKDIVDGDSMLGNYDRFYKWKTLEVAKETSDNLKAGTDLISYRDNPFMNLLPGLINNLDRELISSVKERTAKVTPNLTWNELKERLFNAEDGDLFILHSQEMQHVVAPQNMLALIQSDIVLPEDFAPRKEHYMVIYKQEDKLGMYHPLTGLYRPNSLLNPTGLIEFIQFAAGDKPLLPERLIYYPPPLEKDKEANV